MKLEIFKVGKHTSSNGVTKDYTLEDLNQIITNHSEPTPIVVGHPKDNSPAFGWIKSLFLKGESLFAEATDIVPEFLDLLKQKIYKNRSVSLKTNAEGQLFLNHVAFLGGALPAVKGLEELNLSSDESESFEMEFSEIDFSEMPSADENKQKVSPLKSLSAVAEGTEGGSDNSEEITNLKSLVSNLTSQFNEVLKTFKENTESTTNPALFSEMQTKIDELNIKLDAAYFQRSIQDKLDFSSLTPAIKTKLEKLLEYFQSIDFSEEDSSNIFADFQELADLIEPFQTEEILKKVSPSKRGTGGGYGDSEFSEMNIDKDSLKIYNEASTLAEDEEISFSEAVNKIISNNI